MVGTVNGVFRDEADSKGVLLGAAGDSSVSYDGTDMVVDPQVVGTGNLKLPAGNVSVETDNGKLLLGAGKDASVRYDGTDLIVDPQEVGAGNVKVSAGNVSVETDNGKVLFGAGKDASLLYDGTDLVVNPKEVGAGVLKVSGDMNVTGTSDINGGNIDGTIIGASVAAAGTFNLITANTGINFGDENLTKYDEGTFTPTFTGSGGAPTITYTTQIGEYTRVGNIVDIMIRVTINTISGGSGRGQIANLPFTLKNVGSNQHGVVDLARVNFNSSATYVTAAFEANTTKVSFTETIRNASSDDAAIGDFAAGDGIIIKATYLI